MREERGRNRQNELIIKMLLALILVRRNFYN